MAERPGHIIFNHALDGAAGRGMGLGCGSILKPVGSSDCPGVAAVKTHLTHADRARQSRDGRWYRLRSGLDAVPEHLLVSMAE